MYFYCIVNLRIRYINTAIITLVFLYCRHRFKLIIRNDYGLDTRASWIFANFHDTCTVTVEKSLTADCSFTLKNHESRGQRTWDVPDQHLLRSQKGSTNNNANSSRSYDDALMVSQFRQKKGYRYLVALVHLSSYCFASQLSHSIPALASKSSRVSLHSWSHHRLDLWHIYKWSNHAPTSLSIAEYRPYGPFLSPRPYI